MGHHYGQTNIDNVNKILALLSSGTESDSSASSDVDFDDYGDFGYQLEPEYTEELRQMEEAASAQRRE